MTEKRPLTQINKKSPGSDVAAEAAAAMAAASMVFKSSDTTYSDVLLQHAQKLFTFAVLLILIEAFQVKVIQSSKTSIIPLVMLMNFYGQQVGSIMPQETRHISVM